MGIGSGIRFSSSERSSSSQLTSTPAAPSRMTPSADPGTRAPLVGEMSGRLLGDRYELGATLGEGGMGVVYLARDTVLERSVAVKVFRDGMAEKARTASETQLLASLNHPALVTLFDAHVADDAPRYLVMEYIDGPTLQSRLLAGPLPSKTASRVARDLGEALHVVHQAGIVHRDIKPANVLLRPSSVPGEEFHAKLGDFGIAYLIDSTRVTMPGTVIGSAAYLSPEQIMGTSPGPESDIYSLGLVLLEALTGQRAFAHDGHQAALVRLTQDPVIPASVGTEWATILSDMTARDSARRPSALEAVIRVTELSTRSSGTSSGMTVADAAVTLPQRDAYSGGRSHTLIGEAGAPEVPQRENAPTLVQPSPAPPLPLAAGAHPGGRSKEVKGLVAALFALLLACVVVVGLAMFSPNDDPAPAPTLPALEDPLGSHLEQLLDSVTP